MFHSSFSAGSVLNPRPTGRRILTCYRVLVWCGRAIMSEGYVVGAVVSVLRYPVKSMMGEELTVADVTQGGLFGDRAYASSTTRRTRSQAPRTLASGHAV